MDKRVGWVGLAGCLWPGLALAQPVPVLQPAAGGWALEIPYLEVVQGGGRVAFGVRLTSGADLARFTLDPASLRSTALRDGAGRAPRFAARAGGGYRLDLPYLEVAAGGGTAAYRAALDSADLSVFTVDPAAVGAAGSSGGALAPPTGVTVSEVNTQTRGSFTFASSSRLRVRWSAPAGGGVDHYRVTAREAVQGSMVVAEVRGATETTLDGLKAATPYSIEVAACAEAACVTRGVAAPASGQTSAEYWRLQGSGASVSGLTRVVADGNARISATRFGAEAGANAGFLQLYYGPQGGPGRNPALAVATTAGAVSATDPASYLAFTSLAGQSGLVSPSSTAGTTGGSSATLAQVATGQGVPLSSALGGGVRLFFEAAAADGKTRIYSVDSRDGYLGRDFHGGSATTCSSAADYQAGGACAATLLIGVDGDSERAASRLRNVRQHKIGYPTQDDWRWNGAAGTFMLLTTDQVTGCSTHGMNHAYAQWDGNQWVVQYASDGCPKLFKSAQAMLPMHVGGVRYKAYFGNPSLTTGRITGSNLPFLGPKQLIYADGAVSGAVTTVEFEDWESTGAARDVVFLWPNDTRLDDTAEGYIDDFHFLAPTGSLDLQVAYLAITDGSVAPIAAAAVLLNP